MLALPVSREDVAGSVAVELQEVCNIARTNAMKSPRNIFPSRDVMSARLSHMLRSRYDGWKVEAAVCEIAETTGACTRTVENWWNGVGHLPRSEHLPALQAIIGPAFIPTLFAPDGG